GSRPRLPSRPPTCEHRMPRFNIIDTGKPEQPEKTMTQPIRVAVTGAGGQIGYALLFRIASGGLFGQNQPVELRLLEITAALPGLNGILMELEDCAFPLLSNVVATDQAHQAFEGAEWVILVGGFPRKEGMSRADLIIANSKIFVPQGQTLNDVAGPNVRI